MIVTITSDATAAATLVEALKAATKEKVGVELVLHVKPKGEDGKQQVDDLVEVIKSSSGSVGVIQKVYHPCPLTPHSATMNASVASMSSPHDAGRQRLLDLGC